MLKDSENNDHRTDEGSQPYEDKLSMPVLEINRSVIINSSDIAFLDNVTKKAHKRDYST